MATTVLENVLRDLQTAWFLEGSAVEGQKSQRFPINASPFRVGRRGDLDLTLSSRGVSKLHAEILVTDEILFLRDLGSTNGTYVNGHRISVDTPVADRDLVQFADLEFRIKRLEPTTAEQTLECESFASVAVLAEFERLLDGEGLAPWFQPIVAFASGRTSGFEILARSSVEGLETPGAMFSTAARLEMEDELSIACRRQGLLLSRRLPAYSEIFVNTHPREELMTGVLESLQELRKENPDRPITLEVHEAAVVDKASMKTFKAALRDMNIRLAYDDFGAGQSRLSELAEVPPDYLKFDMGLVRNIDKSTAQQQMVSVLVKMAQELGTATLAEGVESAEEADVCKQLGFEYGQGYYFGKPAPVETWVRSRESSTTIRRSSGSE